MDWFFTQIMSILSIPLELHSLLDILSQEHNSSSEVTITISLSLKLPRLENTSPQVKRLIWVSRLTSLFGTSIPYRWCIDLSCIKCSSKPFRFPSTKDILPRLVVRMTTRSLSGILRAAKHLLEIQLVWILPTRYNSLTTHHPNASPSTTTALGLGIVTLSRRKYSTQKSSWTKLRECSHAVLLIPLTHMLIWEPKLEIL